MYLYFLHFLVNFKVVLSVILILCQNKSKLAKVEKRGQLVLVGSITPSNEDREIVSYIAPETFLPAWALFLSPKD